MDYDVDYYKELKLYSQGAISLATFIGGPIAAGILARRNFINLGKEQLGKSALIIGMVSSILILVGIFSIPEEILDRIPYLAIPVIYLVIIQFLIEKYQGSELREHKEYMRPFYSNWKAVGVGILCTFFLFVCVLYLYL